MPLRRGTDLSRREDQAASIKNLARCVLRKEIQSGHHTAEEDAFTTMELYRTVKEEWERNLCEGRYLFRYTPKKKADSELIIL